METRVIKIDHIDTNKCLWDETAPPPSPGLALDQDIICDVIVIGGGLTGARAALELAQAGTNVVLLEKEKIGFGASGRSGGQVNLGFKLDPDDLVRYVGADTASRMLNAVAGVGNEVFELIKLHNLDCDPVQNGWLKASHCRTALVRQEQQYNQWRRAGLELEQMDGDEIERQTGAVGYIGGLKYAQGGSIQPLSYTRELARVATDYGASIYEGVSALKIARNSGQIRVQTDAGPTVSSEKLIICTNGYTDGMWPGLAQSVVPIRSIQMATEPLSSDAQKKILPAGNTLSDMRRITYYFRLDRDYRLCFGGLGPLRDQFKPDDYVELKRAAEAIFPELKGTNWAYHWGGRLAMTKDSLPHLQELAPGVYAGIGFNGRGIGLGTIMGRNLAELVLGKKHHELAFPITSLSPYPFYRLQQPGFHMATSWMKFRDALDLLRG